jgi:hypothetical protein
VRDTFVHTPLPLWALVLVLVPLVASFAGVAVVARGRRRQGRPLPLAVYGVILAQVSWFAFGVFFPFFNIMLVPVFHSLQYLALTGWHYTKSGPERGLLAFAAYVLTVLALGLLINPGLLALFVPAAGGASGPVAAAAVVSAINLHHFLMDGRIWRIREPRNAKVFAG